MTPSKPLSTKPAATATATQQSTLPVRLGVVSHDWRNAGVTFTSASPHARLHGIPVRAVKLGNGFWTPRRATNRTQSLPSLLRQLEEHGVVDNFRRVSGRKNVPRRGPLYTDSDLYKWMEAAAWTLATDDDKDLKASLDRMIDEVLAAQQPDGYLNTYYILERADQRFTNFRGGHELYCLGHLIQAAIAYYRAAGERKLLDGATRYADYVAATLGPAKKAALTGHPELEMAMVELYRTTGKRAYLDFAAYVLSGAERQRLGLSDRDIVYLFSGIPFTARTKFEGHSVRAMYASAGATDYEMETGDPAYRKTLESLWDDLVTHKMYVTGGVGSRSSGEAIGEPYELPNEFAYSETCAAIGNLMWNWRMLSLTGDARFTDVLERALYNGALSGVSLSGDLYFYRNPLESRGKTQRLPWYDTTCCPPNIQRTLASLPGYFYSTSGEGVWVHLYHNSQLSWHLENGTPIEIAQKTEYPWFNTVDLTVRPAARARFSVFVRVPGWASHAGASVNGKAVGQTLWPGTYLELNREWSPGDRITMTFEMSPTFVQANPRVRDSLGRLAVQRGPLLYCAEGNDQRGIGSLFDLWLPVTPSSPSAGFSSEFRPDLLGGVLVLKHDALVAPVSHDAEPLYRPFGLRSFDPARRVKLNFIPYYSWANREPAEMQVWFPWLVQPAAESRSSAAPNRPVR